MIFISILQLYTIIYIMTQQSLQFRLMRFFHEMDFESQKKAQKFYHFFIVSIAIISYLIASVFQQFSICVYSTLGAMIVSYIVVVPGQAPWWNKPSLTFRPESDKFKAKFD